MHYLKRSYEEYLQEHNIQIRVELDNEHLVKYMLERHPRWYELVETHGSPLETASLKKEGTNIASTSTKVKLVS